MFILTEAGAQALLGTATSSAFQAGYAAKAAEPTLFTVIGLTKVSLGVAAIVGASYGTKVAIDKLSTVKIGHQSVTEKDVTPKQEEQKTLPAAESHLPTLEKRWERLGAQPGTIAWLCGMGITPNQRLTAADWRGLGAEPGTIAWLRGLDLVT